LNKVTINFVIQHIPQKQDKKKIYLILIYISIQAENGVPKKKTENFVLVLTSYKMSHLLNTSCWKGEVTAVWLMWIDGPKMAMQHLRCMYAIIWTSLITTILGLVVYPFWTTRMMTHLIRMSYTYKLLSI
jgi:hypothetical protein